MHVYFPFLILQYATHCVTIIRQVGTCIGRAVAFFPATMNCDAIRIQNDDCKPISLTGEGRGHGTESSSGIQFTLRIFFLRLDTPLFMLAWIGPVVLYLVEYVGTIRDTFKTGIGKLI